MIGVSERGPLLVARNLAKSYAGVRALQGASLELHSGEVHALVGENGAGKSTLIKILTGAVQPDEGEIVVEGQPVVEHSPRFAKALGIAAIYQQPTLFPELTVAENLALGRERRSRWQLIDWRERETRAVELLERLGARIDPDAEAGDLTMPEQQLVEIARALGADAKILVFDEPTASLSEEETRRLFRAINQLKTRGVGIIYISHRLDELPQIAERVTILRDGRTIATRDVPDVSRDQLIHMMVGREVSSVFPKRTVSIGQIVLELRNFGCTAGAVHNVSLELRAGEILGLAGLVGAGRTELARTIFGLTPADAGEICLNGQSVRIANPRDAIALGIAYCPEDRRQHGVVPEMSVASNVTLAALENVTRGRLPGTLDFDRERHLAAEYVHRLGVKTPSLYTSVGALSGGNQQKVALARWLVTKPSVLILDEPTQGIDVAAKAEIHSLMGELAADGVAILMISSELPEILAMSDRILVMRAGTVVDVVARSEATQERILAAALGADAAAAA